MNRMAASLDTSPLIPFCLSRRHRSIVPARILAPWIIAAFTALLTPQAQAASFGEILSQSAIGEPLRVEIRLANSGRAPEGCVRVIALPELSQDGIPGIGRAAIAFRVSGGESVAVITDGRPISHPVVRLRLKDGCASGLQRDYVLLLDAPQEIRRPEASAPPTLSRTSGNAARLSEKPAPQRAGPTIVKRTSKTSPPRPAKTPSPKARPASTPSPHALPLRRNPPSDAAGEASSHSRPQVIASPEKTEKVDQLVVEGQREQKGKPELQMAARLAPATPPTPGTIDRDLIRREQQLQATVEAQTVQQAELAQRLRRLEALQAELRSQLSPPAAPANATPPAPQANKIDVPPETNSAFSWIAGLAALVAATAAVLLWRFRSRPTPKAPLRPIQTPEATSPVEPAPSANIAVPLMLDLTGGQVPDPTEMASLAPSSSDLDAEAMLVAHDSVIELADIMLSFGRVQGAAQALEEFIEAHPKKSLAPWVKLLAVYEIGGMQPEFEALSQRMNQLFNIATIPWEQFDDAMHAKPDQVEDVPHVFEQISQLWNTRDCLKYIDRLLRDNRAGTRQGFPIGVADDLVALQGVLEATLAQDPLAVTGHASA